MCVGSKIYKLKKHNRLFFLATGTISFENFINQSSSPDIF